MEPQKLLHRPRDAQRMLGIGPTKMYELIKTGQLDARKIGRCTAITDESLQLLVAGLPPSRVATKDLATAT
jgi:hypothetical protein